MPYPLFAFSGLLVWNFFASSLRFAVTSLTANSNLVTKVYFPREIFPFSAVLVTLVDSAVGALVLVAMMVYYHVAPTPAIAARCRWSSRCCVVFTCAIALILAMANLFYRDVKYLFELVITVWMFATSVVYPIELVGGKLGMVLRAQPDGADHRCVPGGGDSRRRAATSGRSSASASFPWSLFVAAWVVFHRAEFTFAENI